MSTYYERHKDKIKAYRNANKEKIKENEKVWREANKERVKENTKNYNEINKESIQKYNKEYYQINPNTDKMKIYRSENKKTIKEYNKNYRENNKKELKQKIKKKMQDDILFRCKQNIRVLISHSFKRKLFKKKLRSVEILGCSFEDFKIHLESKFEPWMNWDNKGLYNGTLNYGWDIDHIIPLNTAITVEDVIKLNHHTNLQPLCSHINRNIKRHNII